MRVKIGGTDIPANPGLPVMVELTQQDKENIANMAPDATKYAVFPDGWGTPEEMRDWMRDTDDTGPDVPTPAGPLRGQKD